MLGVGLPRCRGAVTAQYRHIEAILRRRVKDLDIAEEIAMHAVSKASGAPTLWVSSDNLTAGRTMLWPSAFGFTEA